MVAASSSGSGGGGSSAALVDIAPIADIEHAFREIQCADVSDSYEHIQDRLCD